MFKKKKYIRIIVIALVAIVVFLVIAKKKKWIGKEEIMSVSTEQVQKRSITEQVTANGKVQPVTEVKLSPDVSGEIIELYIKEGDKVQAGTLLAKINPDIYISNLNRTEATLNNTIASLAQAKARLAQTQAQYINNKLSFDRSEKLWNQQAISASDFDNAKATYEVSKAEVTAAEQAVISAEYNVKSIEASLKEAKDNLSKTSIYAPLDGTISKLNIEKGERVVGTSQFAGTEIMRISNLNEMEVKVEVNENDIIRVHLNDTSLIEVDAYPNRKFKGIVTSIANSSNSTSTSTSVDQVTNFDVKIRILSESYKDLINPLQSHLSPFRPGMSATVDIQTKKVYNVLSVPVQAVTTRADTSINKSEKKKTIVTDNQTELVDTKVKTNSVDEFVFVYNDGKVIQQKVKTGIQDNNYIEIHEGLKEKQEIVTSPYKAVSKDLKNGDKVKKINKSDLFKK